MHLESVQHKTDDSVHILYRDERNSDGVEYNVSVYVENGQIMITAENAECIVTTVPFQE